MPKSALSLKGLTRRSRCCRADVADEFPDDAQPSWRIHTVKCAQCGQRIGDLEESNDDFEVYNDEGIRIWPVPSDFDESFVPSYRSLCDGDDLAHPIHLPRRLRRRFTG